MAGCGLYALLGFPLDDIWHRIFGQDVTLWGPTHLMMIGGAGFSTLAALYLEHEGRKVRTDDAPPDGIGLKFVQYLAFAGVLIGASVYQIEFDFGVPQFRQVFEPMLIAAAAALALVAARIFMGRGAALIAAVVAIGLRGIVAFLVAPVLDAPVNWFPLYLGAAIIVELLALTPLLKRPVVFGLVAGLGIGTVGTLAGVVVDQRRLLPPVADQHVAGGAGNGRTGRHPHRWLRSDGRHGADRSTVAQSRHRHRPRRR